jgi:hypothetical protein
MRREKNKMKGKKRVRKTRNGWVLIHRDGSVFSSTDGLPLIYRTKKEVARMCAAGERAARAYVFISVL